MSKSNPIFYLLKTTGKFFYRRRYFKHYEKPNKKVNSSVKFYRSCKRSQKNIDRNNIKMELLE